VTGDLGGYSTLLAQVVAADLQPSPRMAAALSLVGHAHPLAIDKRPVCLRGAVGALTIRVRMLVGLGHR
jgi:hypothetical protein